jgi:hypothetical protein
MSYGGTGLHRTGSVMQILLACKKWKIYAAYTAKKCAPETYLLFAIY